MIFYSKNIELAVLICKLKNLTFVLMTGNIPKVQINKIWIFNDNGN